MIFVVCSGARIVFVWEAPLNREWVMQRRRRIALSLVVAIKISRKENVVTWSFTTNDQPPPEMCFPARCLRCVYTKSAEESRPSASYARTQKLSKGYAHCSPNHYAHNKNASRFFATLVAPIPSLFFVFVGGFGIFKFLFISLAAQEHILLSTVFIFFLFYIACMLWSIFPVSALRHREREYCIVCAHKTMTFGMEKKPLFVRIVPLIGWQLAVVKISHRSWARIAVIRI